MVVFISCKNFQVQYLYYSPWNEDRFGGIEEEETLRIHGYIRTKESATCMVRKI